MGFDRFFLVLQLGTGLIKLFFEDRVSDVALLVFVDAVFVFLLEVADLDRQILDLRIVSLTLPLD